MTDSVRSFVAVPLPEKIQADIFAAAQELARRLPDLKWSRKVENLHITVKFLGQIDETKLAELFEPFRQGQRPRTGHRGTGLGLSIVRAVVAAHGGTVEASAVPGGGLRVTVRLKRVRETAVDTL